MRNVCNIIKEVYGVKYIQSLIIAFSMYSKIPMPRIEWNKENMRFSMIFFPFVGIVCGAFLVGFYVFSDILKINWLLKSIIYTLIPIIVTGGIHMDGFLDTIDAISSYQTRERRLEILKDSNSGAFAIIYGISYMLFCVGVWSEIHEFKAALVIAVSYMFSRSLSGYSVTAFKCAKNSGLAATFSNMSDKKRAGIILLIEALISAAVMIVVDIKSGLAAVFAGLIMFIIYRKLSYDKFGGITGDLAGFFLQMCEMFMITAVMLVYIL